MIDAATMVMRRWRLGFSALPAPKRYACALVFGALATAALPPFHVVPLLVPAMVGLVWLIDGSRNWRDAVITGWIFGLAHFVTGIYWIAVALLTEADKFGWMVPFAVFGISGLEALFPAFAALVTHLSRTRGAGRIFVFAAAWTFGEWLRMYAFSGFSWNLIGTGWAFSDPMMQPAAVIGLLGLGMVTMLVCAMPAVTAECATQTDADGNTPGWLSVITAAVLLAAVWIYGAARLAGADGGKVEGVYLRIVQPNVVQHHKWQDDLREDIFRRHLRLTVGRSLDKVTHVVWPETAVPYFLDREPLRRAGLASVVPRGGLLLTGAPRAAFSEQNRITQIWNSLQVIDGAGSIVATYDKHHLVPFGEYVPLRWVLAPLGLEKLTYGAVDFSRGPGAQTVTLDGLPPVSPLICYEAIFPGAVVGDGTRPAWLLNVTNDAWFGASTGPYQHFASARFRAVEEGLPLVRAANTGISAVVDPYGRIAAELALGREGTIDSVLPAPVPGLTPFARYGNAIPLTLALFVGVFGTLMGRRP